MDHVGIGASCSHAPEDVSAEAHSGGSECDRFPKTAGKWAISKFEGEKRETAAMIAVVGRELAERKQGKPSTP